MTQCPICTTQSVASPPTGSDWSEYECPRCGRFKMTRSAQGTLKGRPLAERERAAVSGWIREQNQFGTPPTLDSNRLERVRQLPLPSVVERAERILLHVVRKHPKLGEYIDFSQPELIAISYSVDCEETLQLASFLREQGFLGEAAGGSVWPITVLGHIRAEELRRGEVPSDQGFVAMCFSDEMRTVYDKAFGPAIEDAGYRALRVDQVEHTGRIDDEIVAQIRRSRFVVADFTEHRGGVYFEAGFAMGLGIPVIWTCRQDHVKDLHFDVRQYNCLLWKKDVEGLEELRRRLANRIEAILGRGPQGLT